MESNKKLKEAFLEMLREDEDFRAKIVDEIEEELTYNMKMRFDLKNGE